MKEGRTEEGPGRTTGRLKSLYLLVHVVCLRVKLQDLNKTKDKMILCVVLFMFPSHPKAMEMWLNSVET